MNNPAYDIIDIIDQVSSLGLSPGVDLFENEEPSSPDDCVTVYDTAPHLSPLLSLDPADVTLEYPSIQVRVRNISASSGAQLAWDIKDELHGLINISQGDAVYHGIWCSSGPFSIGRDKNNRSLYTINFEMTR